MHSSVLKEKAIQLRQSGLSIKKIAQLLSVSPSTAHYWVKAEADSESSE